MHITHYEELWLEATYHQFMAEAEQAQGHVCVGNDGYCLLCRMFDTPRDEQLRFDPSD